MPVKRYNGSSWDIVSGAGAAGVAGTNGVDATPHVAGKNYLINGGADIWQRGTTWGGTGYSGADRWYAVAAGTVTLSQEASDLPTGVGVQYGLKYVTGASSSYGQFYQALETAMVKPMRGQTFTVSAYLKLSANYFGTVYCNVDYSTSTDALVSQSVSVASIAFGNAVNAAGWTRFTGTFTVPSDAVGLRIGFVPDNVQPSGVTMRIAAMQLERGSTVTPFARAGGSIGGELALCQRYYYRVANGDVYSPYGMGYASSATQGIFLINHPVPMRVRPISIDYNSIYAEQFNGVSSTAGVATISNSSPFLTRINITGLSGLTTGSIMFAYSNNNTAGYLGFSAEL